MHGYEAALWLCVLAPAGTLAEIVQRLHAEIGKALLDPEVAQSLRRAGVMGSPLGPQELAGFLRAKHEKWGRVIRDTGATLN